MRYVLGIAARPIEEGLTPLTARTVIRDEPYMIGYLDVLVQAFQEFAQPDWNILAVNSIASAAGDRIPRARDICAELRSTLRARPSTWRTPLGILKRPGQLDSQLSPLVVRRRAVAAVDHVEGLLQAAASAEGAVVFASGVFFRPLCGIVAEPGSESYS